MIWFLLSNIQRWYKYLRPITDMPKNINFLLVMRMYCWPKLNYSAYYSRIFYELGC